MKYIKIENKIDEHRCFDLRKCNSYQIRASKYASARWWELPFEVKCLGLKPAIFIPRAINDPILLMGRNLYVLSEYVLGK